MHKHLIIIALVLLAMPMFAQTIETVDVKQAPNGPFTTTTNECTINGNVENGQKVGIWIEYFNGNSYLPKKIASYEKNKLHGLYVEIDKTGAITKKAEYKHGLLDGQMSEWYRGGRLSKLNSYKNGEKDGLQITCYEKGGNLEEAVYKNGLRNGLTVWYYEGGGRR